MKLNIHAYILTIVAAVAPTCIHAATASSVPSGSSAINALNTFHKKHFIKLDNRTEMATLVVVTEAEGVLEPSDSLIRFDAEGLVYNKSEHTVTFNETTYNTTPELQAQFNHQMDLMKEVIKVERVRKVILPSRNPERCTIS